MLNGSLGIEDKGKDFVNGFLNGFHNKKLRTGLMLIAFLLFSSAFGHVLAMLFSLPHIQTYQEPVIIGNVTMHLDVTNVNDLYAWQVAIVYNQSQLKVLEITPSGFVGEDFPFFVNSTDSLPDLLFLAGSLIGDAPGKNGSGRLATITFGYFIENFDEPKIASEKLFETLLLDSQSQLIPIKDSTLTLTIVGEP
jgi:hypothetical protein